MHDTQVAKVVHEAHRALAETTGGAPEPKWEELSEQQRTDKTHDIGSHASRSKKGIDVNAVAKPLPEKERLKYYLTSGITDAFSQHEKSVAGGNSLEINRSEDLSTPPIATINAQNALTRQQTAEQRDKEPKTVEEAQAQAERHIAADNQLGEMGRGSSSPGDKPAEEETEAAEEPDEE